MFSGIVEKIGIIKELTADKLVILEPSIAQALNISDSIASTTALSTFLSFFTLVIVVFLALKYFN